MVDYNDLEEQEIFQEQLKDNYQNPQNVGEIKDYSFFKLFKNPSCGDMFEIYVKLNNDKTIIEEVKFKGNGCAISTASMSLFSQKLIGMDFKDAKKLTDKDMYEILGVRISPGRVNCAMISINAFKAGVEDFEKNN